MNWEIIQANIVTDTGVTVGSLSVEDGKIRTDRPTQKPSSPAHPILSGESLFLYPALINAHDHLIGSYSPSVLDKSPYPNWLAWDNALKSSLAFSERQTLETIDLYFLGAYKNLIGGTTTVMDHIPHFVNQAMRDEIPIRLVRNYSLAHSIGSYTLGWGDGPALEYRIAAQKKIPFVTHIGEGIDDESKDSLRLLEKWNALGEYSVLVHALPFLPRDVQKIKKFGAHIVWCPTSNLNLYGITSPIKSFREAGVPISLGTDLAMTGSTHILDEMKQARNWYRDTQWADLPAKELFQMVTTHPAKALQIEDQLGSIEAGKWADFLFLPKRCEDPYENLLLCGPEDIVLLTREGRPLLADARLEDFVSEWKEPWDSFAFRSHPNQRKLLTGSPHSRLKKIHSSLGYKKDLAFLPILE